MQAGSTNQYQTTTYHSYQRARRLDAGPVTSRFWTAVIGSVISKAHFTRCWHPSAHGLWRGLTPRSAAAIMFFDGTVCLTRQCHRCKNYGMNTFWGFRKSGFKYTEMQIKKPVFCQSWNNLWKLCNALEGRFWRFKYKHAVSSNVRFKPVDITGPSAA